jgi:hypothetical protein
MVDPEQLKTHAERIRASGVLGRSTLIQRLFDFFVECSATGKIPKEIEVALDVFDKRVDFDVAQDAMVRVYIHKLRRKLDEYYAGPGKQDSGRLMIPKGEYRFLYQEPVEAAVLLPEVVAAGGDDSDADLALAMPKAHRVWLPWLLAVVALLLIVNLVVLALRPSNTPGSEAVRATRGNPIWAHLLDDNLPIYIVVGDYYIFGELDDSSMEVSRLVREYNINSPTDLEQYLKNHPDLAGRYMDLSLQYLPTSAAYALRNLMPLLEPNAKSNHQVQVILASDLTPSMVKSSHIIYVGLLSGMGILKEMVFSNSQFAIGDSYDELIDRATQKHYFSQGGMIEDTHNSYRDFGFFYAHTGEEGNELIVLAGTRDVALLHTAETVTAANSLTPHFEALFQVEALDRTNIDGHLISTHRLKSAAANTP